MNLKLPELKIKSTSIDGNLVLHMAENARYVTVVDTKETVKCINIKTQCGLEVILLKPRVKVTDDVYLLRIVGDYNSLDDLKNIELKWLNHPSINWPKKPGEIVESWKGEFTLNSDNEGIGLRVPQLGAIHAISAHWSVSNEDAVIVMPTGTGKTETMMATTIYERCEKVLVIVPTDTLRTQIFNKFSTFGCLRNINCFVKGAPNPIVCRLSSGVKSVTEVKKLLANSNVIVATAAVLSNCSDNVKKTLASQVTQVFVDEAHHVPAPTWEKVKVFFSKARILQFTATPFRNDRKRIKGKIIYNYPLGLAQDENYFKEINLLTVVELDDQKSDEKIALKAISQLEDDLSRGLDHLILARTKTIRRAEEVLKLYKSHASKFVPVAIYSHGMPKKEQREKVKQLEERVSRILICVDMFGEGFDLPNLKIAAMHDIHKTLPITLQFIGRFTRVSENVGNASVVINLDDPKTSEEIQGLYSQDANWNHLVRRASEDKIQEEIDIQDFINSFDGVLPDRLPLWNMRPGFSTLIFKNPELIWNPKKIKSCLHESVDSWLAESSSTDTVILVIAKKEDVKWGKYENIKNHLWNIIIVHLDRDQGFMYIYQSDYRVVNPVKVSKSIAGEKVELLTGPSLFRVFSNIERPMIKNLGATKAGSISFTMFFGPEVSAGLSQVEKAQSELNNLLGWGYENGNKVIFGSSHRKGKVWSVAGGGIRDWISWCKGIGEKVLNEKLPQAEVVEDFLRPVIIYETPIKYPIAIEWGEHIFRELEDKVIISFEREEYKVHEIDIFPVDDQENNRLLFSIKSENVETVYELKILVKENDESTYEYIKISGPDIFIKKGSGERKSLEDWMVRDPVIFMYGDGSFSYNNFLVEAPCIGEISPNSLLDINWENINIKKESEGPERNSSSIQFNFIERMKDDDYDVIFNDDGPGEAADIIALKKESDESVTLTLVHCKYSKGKSPGGRINDLYDVCGQAQKSIKWKHRPLRELRDHIKRRELSWLKKGKSRFRTGSNANFRILERYARKKGLKLKIIIVQPGLSKSKLNEDIKRLLGTTEQYLSKTSEANLTIYCSS